jgi:hypothetical protein
MWNNAYIQGASTCIIKCNENGNKYDSMFLKSYPS